MHGAGFCNELLGEWRADHRIKTDELRSTILY